ncbi:efflux RND transporter permease subunit [bacterium]|nr:MAG: efflux RND transporter permease subunit [bacterium]
MKLADYSIRRPVTTMMVFISLVLVGGIASRLLPLEYFPDISFPGAYIEIPYPNASPAEIEQLITRPVEEALATIPGIRLISSDSEQNRVGIFVRFDMKTDLNLKSIEIQEKIDGVRNTLPDDLERFFVRKFSAQDDPVLQLRISSDRDLSNSYDLLFRNIKQRVERVEGVSKVELYGVEKKQVRIDLISDRVDQFNVDVNQLVNTLRRENFAISAGKALLNDKRFLVRPLGEFTTVDEIKELVIGEKNLRLKDVADVTYSLPMIDYGRHLDMKYAIGLDIYKESGANTVKAVELVKKELEEIKEVPEMAGITLYEMNNQADGIVSSLSDLLNSGMIGAVLSVFVLFIFLRSMSTTLIVALAVPFSLMVTLGAMYFMGYTLNILSMMGLMLAVGMLVDNAVVVTENIHRHQLMNADKVDATIKAVKEVGIAVTAGTLTSVIVFFPNIINQGDMTAIFLEHVSVSIIISLVASLVISLTVIPLLSTRFGVKSTQQKESAFFEKLTDKYSSMLGWLTDHRYTSVGILILIVVTAALPMNFMKTDMFPNEEGRTLRLFYNLNGTYVLEKVEKSVLEVEKFLYDNKEKFEIESVYTFYTPNFAVSTITLYEDDKSEKPIDDIKREIRDGLPKLAIADPVFDWRSMMGQEQMRVHLIGESNQVLMELSDEVIRRLEGIEGLVDVRSEAETGSEEVRLIVDREKAKSYGLNTQQVASMVSAGMRGQSMKKIRLEFTEVDVIISFQDTDKQSLEDLRKMSLPNGKGDPIRLASLANIETGGGPQRIHRENRQTSLAILANLDGVTRDKVQDKIQRVMDQIAYPTGYGWSYGRSFRDDDEAMNSMLFNMLLALVLIYIVMAALFESLIYPASIITSILFAVIGVFWFFWITNTTFSLMAMIGILILMGVVVNNGIVLIDHINQLRNEGYTRKEAIMLSGKNRLRPILMTVGTTVLGLIPLCLGTTQIGGDGPPYFPMARAIVGGLLFSTFITLVILPTIYILLDEMKLWSSRIINNGLKV